MEKQYNTKTKKKQLIKEDFMEKRMNYYVITGPNKLNDESLYLMYSKFNMKECEIEIRPILHNDKLELILVITEFMED